MLWCVNLKSEILNLKYVVVVIDGAEQGSTGVKEVQVAGPSWPEAR